MVPTRAQDLPGAILTSKHSAVIGLPGDWKPFRHHCNRLLSLLSTAGILERAAPVGDRECTVLQNGEPHKFAPVAPGCAQYRCNLPTATVRSVADDSDYCTPREDLPACQRQRSGRATRGCRSSTAPTSKRRKRRKPVNQNNTRIAVSGDGTHLVATVRNNDKEQQERVVMYTIEGREQRKA